MTFCVFLDVKVCLLEFCGDLVKKHVLSFYATATREAMWRASTMTQKENVGSQLSGFWAAVYKVFNIRISGFGLGGDLKPCKLRFKYRQP